MVDYLWDDVFWEDVVTKKVVRHDEKLPNKKLSYSHQKKENMQKKEKHSGKPFLIFKQFNLCYQIWL